MRRTKVERHGLRYTREYKAWDSMKERCTNKNNRGYHRYGGRGIKVCDRWLESFVNFYEDMGAKPSPEHSLDRINNDGNYDPDNCRWATWSEQNLNRTFTNHPYPNGVHFSKQAKKFKVNIRIDGRFTHLGYFSELEDAIAARRRAEKQQVVKKEGEMTSEKIKQLTPSLYGGDWEITCQEGEDETN